MQIAPESVKMPPGLNPASHRDFTPCMYLWCMCASSCTYDRKFCPLLSMVPDRLNIFCRPALRYTVKYSSFSEIWFLRFETKVNPAPGPWPGPAWWCLKNVHGHGRCWNSSTSLWLCITVKLLVSCACACNYVITRNAKSVVSGEGRVQNFALSQLQTC